MNPTQIQKILTTQHEGDHVRVARIQHFMGLLKSGIDGMASLGVVLRIEAEGMPADVLPQAAAPDPLSALDTAIAFMQGASTHATHEEGNKD